jgi:hypothetical protein
MELTECGVPNHFSCRSVCPSKDFDTRNTLQLSARRCLRNERTCNEMTIKQDNKGKHLHETHEPGHPKIDDVM